MTEVEPAGEKKEAEDRDPSGVNAHLALAFEEVFGEPADVKSCACVWGGARACFSGSRSCCYNILAGLCGLCQALCFGCDFAWTTFCHVWCFTPQIRLLSICLHLFARIWKLLIDCYCTPLCDQVGRGCGKGGKDDHVV